MKRILFVLCLVLLVGCSEITGEDDFKASIAALEEILNSEDWEAIERHTEAIEQQYDRSEWKLQLIGDEDEYEGLQESVNHLQQAAKSKSKIDCEKELTTIRTYLDLIYSL